MTERATIERQILARVALASRSLTSSTTVREIAEALAIDAMEVDRVLKALVLSGDVAIDASWSGGWRYRLRGRAVGHGGQLQVTGGRSA